MPIKRFLRTTNVGAALGFGKRVCMSSKKSFTRTSIERSPSFPDDVVLPRVPTRDQSQMLTCECRFLLTHRASAHRHSIHHLPPCSTPLPPSPDKQTSAPNSPLRGGRPSNSRLQTSAACSRHDDRAGSTR